jgi:GAF domain-containing protein
VTQGTDDLDYVAVVRAQADVARVAVQSHEPQAALDLLVNRLRALLRARQCFVILVGVDQRLRITASSGLSTRHREVLPLHERDGIGLTAMIERRTVSSADVLNDPAIDLSPSSRRFIESEGYRGALAVPLLADTRVLGVLLAGRDRVGSFSPDQAEVARAFSDLATMALERARLFSQEAARTRLDEALVEVEREMLAELRGATLLDDPRTGRRAGPREGIDPRGRAEPPCIAQGLEHADPRPGVSAVRGGHQGDVRRDRRGISSPTTSGGPRRAPSTSGWA